jgi:hypothetical protein
MTQLFKQRAQALENEYFHRETMAYRNQMQRTRIFGLMLADAMGFDDDRADEYANTLVDLFADTRSDEILLDQVLCDLQDIGIYEKTSILEAKLMEAERLAEEEYSF